MNKLDIEQVRQAAAERLKKAGKALSGRSASGPRNDEAVHSARRRIKEARALLRLSRKALGKKRFRQDNKALRDAARPLSTVRDATAVINALDALQENQATAIDDGAFRTLRTAFEHRRTKIAGRQHPSNALSESADAIERVRKRNRKWRFDGDASGLVAAGLKRTYKKGYQAWVRTLAESTNENLHELRKRVKDLRYQLELLATLWPAAMKEPALAARKLSDLLGDDHDLTLLRSIVRDELHETLDGETVQTLSQSIDRRQADLRQDAWSVAQPLFAASPGQFMRRADSRKAAA